MGGKKPETKETKAVKKAAKALVVKEKVMLPAIPGDSIAEGFEEVDDADIRLGYLKLMQPLSPEVQEDGSKVKPGNILNSITGFNYGNEIIIMPLKYIKKRTKWIARDEGGGIDCMASHGRKPDTGKLHSEFCKDCAHSKWTEVGPACDEMHTFLSLIEGDLDQENAIIQASFTRTSSGAGKRIIQLGKLSGKSTYAKKYKITTKKETNDKGTFHVFVATSIGNSNEDELKVGKAWFDNLGTANLDLHEENYQAETYAAKPSGDENFEPAGNAKDADELPF